MLATVAGQSDVVNLLKNKYGQQEPSPEVVSSLVFCMYKHTYIHTYIYIYIYIYMYVHMYIHVHVYRGIVRPEYLPRHQL